MLLNCPLRNIQNTVEWPGIETRFCESDWFLLKSRAICLWECPLRELLNSTYKIIVLGFLKCVPWQCKLKEPWTWYLEQVILQCQSAYKWEVCGSLRVAPAYTARSDLFLTLKYSPQFNSLALVVHSQLMVCLCWWRGGILFCFIVGFSQSHSV